MRLPKGMPNSRKPAGVFVPTIVTNVDVQQSWQPKAYRPRWFYYVNAQEGIVHWLDDDLAYALLLQSKEALQAGKYTLGERLMRAAYRALNYPFYNDPVWLSLWRELISGGNSYDPANDSCPSSVQDRCGTDVMDRDSDFSRNKATICGTGLTSERGICSSFADGIAARADSSGLQGGGGYSNFLRGKNTGTWPRDLKAFVARIKPGLANRQIAMFAPRPLYYGPMVDQIAKSMTHDFGAGLRTRSDGSVYRFGYAEVFDITTGARLGTADQGAITYNPSAVQVTEHLGNVLVTPPLQWFGQMLLRFVESAIARGPLRIIEDGKKLVVTRNVNTAVFNGINPDQQGMQQLESYGLNVLASDFQEANRSDPTINAVGTLVKGTGGALGSMVGGLIGGSVAGPIGAAIGLGAALVGLVIQTVNNLVVREPGLDRLPDEMGRLKPVVLGSVLHPGLRETQWPTEPQVPYIPGWITPNDYQTLQGTPEGRYNLREIEGLPGFERPERPDREVYEQGGSGDFAVELQFQKGYRGEIYRQSRTPKEKIADQMQAIREAQEREAELARLRRGPNVPESNTGLYVGIGVFSVLAIVTAIVAFWYTQKVEKKL